MGGEGRGGGVGGGEDDLEGDEGRPVGLPPEKKRSWGPIYHANAERGYHVNGSSDHGKAMIIEDFFNADPAFDFLVDHPRTMEYIRSIVQGPVRINNSEIRLRFPGNATGTHMGGPISHKYRYGFNAQGIECIIVRMIYLLHHVT